MENLKSNEPAFQMLLITQHFYTNPPIEGFDESFCRHIKRKCFQAPAITFYGRMRNGKRIGLHIHGCYPYFYVQLPQGYIPDFRSMSDIIENEVNATKIKPIPIIHDMEIVEKIPFYGYHTEKVQFLRISVHSVETVKQVAMMLCDGICGVKLQPYEAHIDIFQQIYTEYDLSGMRWIGLKSLSFRMPCSLKDVPMHNIEKSTYCELEADCMVFDIEKIEQKADYKFRKISMLSILNIWFNESDRRKKKHEKIVESVPEMPENYILTHDQIQDSDYRYRLLFLNALNKDNQDTLRLCSPANLNAYPVGKEDDLRILDDVLNISRPKPIEETPKQEMKNLFQTPAQKYHIAAIKDFAERMSSTVIRKFYFSEAQFDKMVFAVNFAYEFIKEPPNYNTILESCKYNVRIVNQPIYLGIKSKILTLGITNHDVMSNYNLKGLPHFAHKLLTLKAKADPFQNSYLYKPSPPTYDLVLKYSQSQYSESLSESLNITPVKAHISVPAPDICKSFVTLFYLEVFVETRGQLLPDPKVDQIRFAAYKIQDDIRGPEQGIIQVGFKSTSCIRGKYIHDVSYLDSEIELFEFISGKIQKCDPDFITGFETDNASIGYLLKRAKYINFDIGRKISRIEKSSTFTAANKRVGEKIPGRMILSGWRIVKAEVNFLSYTFQNVVYLILNARLPCYSSETLTKLFRGNKCMVYDYIWDILIHNEKLFDHYSIIERNVLLAQVYCMDLPSVFTRGSQYRVECLLKKIIKNTDFLLLSAMPSQVKSQKQLEQIPLVMEPEKKLWTDPIVVLDFQSLYQSIMIAYNLCYTTCLGKLEAQEYKKFGVTCMKGSIYSGEENIVIAPNNVGYLNWRKRRGILPRMMHELLQTRIMIKNAMKNVGKESIAYIQLFSQQLGIKTLGNTTYGYTGAGFTGRMPCNDIADSIVSFARKTVEAAMDLVNSNPVWEARVIYGDTDSLMILLPGRTVDQAFQIGREIASTINKSNPKPVELLLEKVYFPMITLAKKHYAGLKYDRPGSEPVFDAKGIETVRRDNCPLAAKILEKALRILFERDISGVYDFLCKEWNQILSGKARLIDLIFHQKVSTEQYKNPPPAAIVAKRKEEEDEMAKPIWGERVGYVVICGPPGDTLSSQVVSPEEYLSSPDYHINYTYYIERNINVILNRSLSAVGIDVNAWYQRFPQKRWNAVLHTAKPMKPPFRIRSIRLDKFYQSAHCLICRTQSSSLDVCESCSSDTMKECLSLMQALKKQEKKLMSLNELCRSCTGTVGDIECISLDCPIYLEKLKVKRALEVRYSKVLTKNKRNQN